MLCDYCHQEEAIIHIQEIRPDGNKTINLCAKCAMANMSKLHPGFAHAEEILNQIMSLFEGKDAKVRLEEIFNRQPDVPMPENDLECPGCHQKLSDFLKNNRLACQQCAETFADYLKILLEKKFKTELPAFDAPAAPGRRKSPAHPAPFDTDTLRKDELARLKRELDCAIKVEDYEKAAQLRDIIAEYTPANPSPKSSHQD